MYIGSLFCVRVGDRGSVVTLQYIGSISLLALVRLVKVRRQGCNI